MAAKSYWRNALKRLGVESLVTDVIQEIQIAPRSRRSMAAANADGVTLSGEMISGGINVANPSTNELPSAPRHSGRVWFIMFILAIATILIVVRLVSYQFTESTGELVDLPSRNPPVRGVVLDRNGNLFAQDRFEYEVRLAPDQIKTDDERSVIASGLEEILGISGPELKRALEQDPNGKFLMVTKDLPFEEGQRILAWIEEKSEENPILDKIEVAAIPIRFYPQKALAAHTIGFVGLSSERPAHFGIEEYFSEFLSEDGIAKLTRTEREPISVLSPEIQRFIPSPAGRDIVLTLDRGIQWIIEDELYQGLQLYGAQRGTIIVMEPKTGAVLGLANWPTYDPNNYPESDPEIFQNAAISAQYEPGSIFKVITMAAALDADVIEPDSQYIDSGSITIGERVILNSSRTGAGEVTAAQALALSINVVTAQIAEELGYPEFYNYVRRFGFGQATEVDLADEIPGAVKSPGSEEWSFSDLGTNSFGQGIAVTPIQMVNSVAAIANGGYLMRPYVIQSRAYDDQVQQTEPTVANQAISPESAAQITEMMVGVVEVGATAAYAPGYTVAGKTGTAQIPGEGGYLEDETIVSFVGFGPVEDPQFVILVKMERPNPDISQWATATAAPVFSRVALRLFDYLGIPPKLVSDDEESDDGNNGEIDEESDAESNP